MLENPLAHDEMKRITRTPRLKGSLQLEPLPSESFESSNCCYEEEVLELEVVNDSDDEKGLNDSTNASNDHPEIISENSEDIGDDIDGSEALAFEDASLGSHDHLHGAKERKGLLRIEKLDRLLKETSEREIEVKRERRLMEQKFRMEIEDILRSKGHDVLLTGATRLLELCACHDSESEEPTEGEDYEPVFATQVDFDAAMDVKAHRKEEPPFSGSSRSDQDRPSEEVMDTLKSQKNFIARNIQLASHANEVVAMTDEERKRLDDILADETDLLFSENPFRKTILHVAIGYGLTEEERERMKAIDERLSALVPISNAGFVEPVVDASTSSCLSASSLPGLSDNAAVTGTEAEDEVEATDLSMHALKLKLAEVDDHLERLRQESEMGSNYADTPRLSISSLRMLLDVDSRMTSSSLSSYATSSERPFSRSQGESCQSNLEGDLETSCSLISQFEGPGSADA